MSAFNKFRIFVLDLSNGKHNLGSDVLRVMLSNTLPLNTNAVKADITEIANGNGYTSGTGNQATLVSNTQTAGVEKLILNNVTFTASGGSINTFQYVVLYNDTQTSPAKPLIAWYDYGAAQVITSGNSFQVQFDGTNGVLTIT